MQEEGREEGSQDYEYVTEAYGAASLSAKVTKHVARVKMPNSGLSWDDDSLVNLREKSVLVIYLSFFR